AMLKSVFAAAVTAAVTLLGCSSEPRSVDQQSTSGALRDRRAEGCEIFVDRAIATTGSHALRRITLYVKTRNGDLDAPIDHVAFHRRADVTGCNTDDCDRERPWQDIRMQNF